VQRTVNYRDGKREVINYYYCYRAGFWSGLPEREEFYQALVLLPAELRLYALLLAEANFGERLKWEQIQMVMEDAQQMGLLTVEEHLEYNLSLEKAMLRELEKTHFGKDVVSDYDKKKEMLTDLLKEARFTPLEVMGTMSAYGIMPPHPMWCPAAGG